MNLTAFYLAGYPIASPLSIGVLFVDRCGPAVRDLQIPPLSSESA